MVLTERRRKRLTWAAVAVAGICLPAAFDFNFFAPSNVYSADENDDDISEGVHRTLTVPTAAPLFTLHKLRTTQALCLDGTPGAFYYRPSASGSTDKWQIFFEGGGWCYDEDDCSGRAATNLGSSRRYHAAVDNPGMAGGITSNDCEVNPTFCDFNLVYMKYCDGDSFSGARADAVVVVPEDGYNDPDDDYAGRRKSPIYFRGHHILMESLEYMKTELGMSGADTLHVTGCSAGGLAAYLNADTIGEWAEGNLLSLSKYAVSPVSGFFLEHNTVSGDAVFPEQMQYVFDMQNAKAGLNRKCIAAKSDEDAWQCNFAYAALSHTSYPVFAIDASFDSWQASNIFVSPRYDSDTEGFDRCALGVKASRSGIHCAKQQMMVVDAYQDDFVEQLTADSWAGLLDRNPGNGAFVYQCFTHCAGSRDDYYSGFAVNNVTMSDAVDNWWNELDETVQVQDWDNIHIDESFPLDGRYSNPSCPATLGGRSGTHFQSPRKDVFLKVGAKHSMARRDVHAKHREEKQKKQAEHKLSKQKAQEAHRESQLERQQKKKDRKQAVSAKKRAKKNNRRLD